MRAGSSSAATREALLGAGLQLATRVGLRGVTVRGVSQQAGVNPGSFVYHFGNRDDFLRVLLERWYAPLYSGLEDRLDEVDLTPMNRLRAMMLQAASFMNSEGAFIAQIFTDALAGERVAREFIATMSPRHLTLLVEAVQRAQSVGELVEDDPVHVLLVLLASVGAPAVVTHLVAGQPVMPAMLQDALVRFGTNEQAMARRLDWVLRGLAVQGKKRTS